ncbi:F-box protein At4g22280-like [Carex rostrata]
MKSVLAKREVSYVNKFQLWLDSEIDWPHTQAVVDCIGDMMKLGPQECLVEMGSCEKLNLNTGFFFTCASLIHLRLLLSTYIDDSFVAIEPNSVNLPCLKTLNLVGVTLSDDSLKRFLLGCPVLEDLVLDDCIIHIIEICSKTLKKLVVHKCYDVIRFQISTPNLLYLDMCVVPMVTFLGTRDMLLLNMLLLVHASIYIPYWHDEDIYITRGPKLIHSLSNVESLQLEFDYIQGMIPKKDFLDFPVFNNLKRLKLPHWRFYCFDLAPYFLLHSPKLQELTLTNQYAHVTEFVDEEITQEGLGDALVQREFLKTVRIVGFKNGNGFVDQLINKLLVHVKIVGEIEIVRRDPCP